MVGSQKEKLLSCHISVCHQMFSSPYFDAIESGLTARLYI